MDDVLHHDLLDEFEKRFTVHSPEEMSLTDYLNLCKKDPMAYAYAAQRMVDAIGEPVINDTSKDQRLARLFGNREIRTYPAFDDFYGLEDTIEHIVDFFRHGAQGLEESRQILYLLGPVGGGKSSLVTRLRGLMEKRPIYTLAYRENGRTEWSPYFSRVLPLFAEAGLSAEISKKYDIPPLYMNGILGPWERKRLVESKGSLKDFRVVKIYPSRFRQIAISEAEPGDENTQDISTLVGKVDMRKLEMFSQNDPDAYLYSGALNLSNQGMMEFKEMFKAKIKMLNPLLFAVQEHNYQGTENIAALPYNGIVVAHCFSEDTQLLTEQGWRGVDEIEEGDSIATLNTDRRAIEYQPALQKFVYDYDGDMYHFESSAADHLVTPNHKMLYESYGTFKKVLAEDFDVQAKIPVSGIIDRDDLSVYESDDELRFHVWCVTDGTLAYQQKRTGNINYRFRFRKERKVVRLTALLDRLGYIYDKAVVEDCVTRIIVNGISPKYTKQLGEFHRLLSPRQTTIMFEEWSNTDGHQPIDRPQDHFILYTNVPFHKDLIQELAAISGHKTTCTLNKKEGYSDGYRLHVRLDTQLVACRGINKGTVGYQGRVWCLETPNHTIIARRNGKVLVTSNSNEGEWNKFKNNRDNEAFLDRICIVKVPYCLRVNEEIKIYQKAINESELSGKPVAPDTLEVLAQFSCMSRLKEPANASLWSKLRVYNGENLREKDPKTKSYQEYRDDPENREEGFFHPAISTRWAFKRLSQCFNRDPHEIAADPVHMLHVLLTEIEKDMTPEQEEKYKKFIKDEIKPKYFESVNREIRAAFLESYTDYGQNLFDRYVLWADHWCRSEDYFDSQTSLTMNREALEAELSKIEKPADIANPKDFRNEITNWVLRYKAHHEGQNPSWRSYEKLRQVIETTMFSKTEELLPVISFGKKSSTEQEKKHTEFVQRMCDRGYTERQIRRIVDWYMRVNKSQ